MTEVLKKDNVFVYKNEENAKYEFQFPISIPFDDNVEEFVKILMRTYKMPQYLSNDIYKKLNDYIKNKTEEHYDHIIDDLVTNSKNSINDITKAWTTAFREGNVLYSERTFQSDEEVFATAYHKLVHSSALETMLELEHRYAHTVQKNIKNEDEEISALTTRQTNEMVAAVEALDLTTTEQKINELATKHFNDHSLLQAKCWSELNGIREAQRREYRDWIMNTLENHTRSLSPPSSPLMSAAVPIKDEDQNIISNDDIDEPPLEESFTIHLGSQLKQMHNIRLISANIADFCRTDVNLSRAQHSPQRLQTAMSLYSNDLCGLVVLTDNNIGFSNVTTELIKLSQQSTEFHFPHVEDQLEKIAECARTFGSIRKSKNQLDRQNLEWQKVLQKVLVCGDTFITKHSNLDKVHIVFHLIVDDSLRSNDINSRHLAILGLRNILKTACSNNVTTLTLPLLLQHDMTEEMTVQWCIKRAELVFKCVKGFMIEMASWGGSDLKNLQFLLPKGISHSVFTTLSTMLPSIFKLSNPVIFKAINK